MSEHRLFVYGTLQPGQPNAHILECLPGDWNKASVRGHFHPEGWGKTAGYPAIKLDPDGYRIDGYVYVSAALEDDWDRIDAFEGDAYHRVSTLAELETGRIVSACVYVLRETD